MDQEEIKKSIFIVDDDEFLLDMYAVKFRESGFSVEISFGGQDALDKIREGLNPDIILLDVIMPNMDGFEFLQRIKKENLLKNTKIVILTNLGQKEDIKKGMELGASDYVVKAYFTPSEIVQKIDLLLKQKK
ncbi:MAG: response regulator [Patescibacteria group bacterium]